MSLSFLSMRLAACLSVALCFGCGGPEGPERVAVSGKVTFEGKPLEQGTVMFIPAEGVEGPSTGAAIENGQYTVPPDKGAVVGPHLVQITSMQTTGEMIPAGTGAPPGTMVEDMRQVIPAEYNRKSTLTVEIKPGENENVNFDL